MPRRREGKRMTVSPKTRAAGAIEQRSALDGAGRPQCRGGRHLLLLGSDHRRVLPPLVRRTAAAPGERAVPRHQGGSGAGRIPPLQAVPSRPSVARGTARRHRNGDLPPDRDLVPRPGARALAARAGMSPFHFHRVFKAVTGLTPRAYAAAHRGERVRRELGKAPTVTAAIYDSGYSSNGRFYGESEQMLGMTPTEYRAGGASAEIRFAVGECSLGSILVARSERGVCAIFLGDDPDALARELQDRFPRATLIGGDPAFEDVVAKVVGLMEAPGSRSRPAAGRAGHGVPAAGLAGAAGDSGRLDGELPRDRQSASERPAPCGRWRTRARSIRWRSRSLVIGWCGATAGSRATAGASSASASCWSARPPDERAGGGLVGRRAGGPHRSRATGSASARNSIRWATPSSPLSSSPTSATPSRSSTRRRSRSAVGS